MFKRFFFIQMFQITKVSYLTQMAYNVVDVNL